MSDIIINASTEKRRLTVSRNAVIARALIYAVIVTVLAGILPMTRGSEYGSSVLLCVAVSCALAFILFAHETYRLYKNSGLKNRSKVIWLDLGLIALAVAYWVTAHAVWYSKGEVRFYDALIFAVCALPYAYRLYRIFDGSKLSAEGKKQ